MTSGLRHGWDLAAGRPDRGDAAVHPAGAVSTDAYEQSGRDDAITVLADLPAEPDWRVMEFGAGNGRITRHLAAAWGVLYAADLSEPMLRHIDALSLPRVETLRWDGLSAPPVTELDGVFSHSVLIHNSIGDGTRILAHLAAVCRRGAKLLIQVPLYDELREAKDWTDVTCWTPRLFAATCAEAGLVVERASANRGRFDFAEPGPNHHLPHLLRRA